MNAPGPFDAEEGSSRQEHRTNWAAVLGFGYAVLVVITLIYLAAR